MHILETITIQKRKEINNMNASLEDIKAMPMFSRECHSLTASLLSSKVGLICEFKRKSPSKKNINMKADLKETVLSYTSSGASGISVLTDYDFFGGSLEDLTEARHLTNLPILRKEFIIDPIQIYEAKAYGADVILLIGSILTKEESLQFCTLAQSLGMEVIFEIHHENEIEKIPANVNIIGVNNRNLDTFITDYKYSLHIKSKLPQDKVIITESGISNPIHLKELYQAGYQGALIGEHFMKADNPSEEIKSFCTTLDER